MLLVEDEVLIRLMLADELRSQGLRCWKPPTPTKRLTVLQSSLPVHLLFTDIRMPGDGWRGAGQNRARALPGDQEHHRFERRGRSNRSSEFADAFLAKPYDLRELVKQVRRLLVDRTMSASQERSAKAGETVLVVEGDVLLRLSISAYLRDCGYKVIEAADAEEAVLVLKQPKLDVDVLFSESRCRARWTVSALAQWTRANRPGWTSS